jgi:hypothetical protein
MNPQEETPAPGYQAPLKNPSHGMTPEEIQEIRRRLQANLRANKPEKEAKLEREKNTYRRMYSYIINEPLKKLSDDMYTEAKIDGKFINVSAAQAYLKKNGKDTFPIYPGTSKDIQTLETSKEIEMEVTHLEHIDHKKVMIITSDGIMFDAVISNSNQTMKLFRYVEKPQTPRATIHTEDSFDFDPFSP